MRRLSATIAIAGFFVLAGVAMARSVPVFDCAVRGLIGAAVLFVVAQVAGKAVVSVVVDAFRWNVFPAKYLVGWLTHTEKIEVGHQGLVHEGRLLGLVVLGVVRFVEDAFNISLPCDFC